MPMKLHVGDIIETKKPHPCGSKEWEICRIGMDFRIRCLGCQREVWLPRPKLEKSVKRILHQNTPPAQSGS